MNTCLIDTIREKIMGKATSYRVVNSSTIFIPVNDKRTLIQTEEIARERIAKVNKEYNSKVFGNVATYYSGINSPGTVIKINPSLALIKANEVREGKITLEEANIILERKQELERQKPKETLSQEIQENREYFENDEPFTRTSTNIKPNITQGTQSTLFQEPGRSLQELDNLPEKEIENLQSTVEYQILNEQEEEDLTIKGGQSYVFLNKRDAERFSFLLNREGEFPKEFRVEKKITRYKKDSEVKGKFNAFNEYEDYHYSKVNNNKKSNLYNITNEKTGEVIAENVRVLHVSKDVKKGISEKYGLEFTPTKVFSANRSIGFTLYRLKPSKNKYVAQAKKYLYDALKFLNPEETNLKINLDKIEGFLESFPKDMWDYINTTYSPEDSTNINASILLQNKIKFELPKLGFLQEVEKITGIPLQGVSFKNYDRSGWIEKKLKYGWKEVVTIDYTLFSADKLRGLIAYYLDSKGYFKPSSKEENVRKYAEHRGIDYNKLRELVFGDIDKAFDNISYNTTGNSDTIELSKWRESIREYNWQSVELFKKPYDNFQNTVKERITKKFKDKTLSNGISHLDYFFSGNFNWLNINFNNISGQYYMSDMETEADTGFDVKMVGFANPFELKTYKKPEPGKNFLEEKEVFNRLAAILHEPFHALHALSYGTEEELQLRKAFDNLYNTNFGKEMMNQVFGSGYNQKQQISYDTLYKEFTAFATQLMLYPKEWITKTDLRSNDIYDFVEKVQTLQDKTYEEIVRTQQKIGTTKKTITEEEQIKLTFLEKLYNYLVSALNKIIPLSKKFFDVIADSKLVEKTVIEDVFGETEETVTKTLKLPENIKKAKEEFLSSMEDLKSAINTLMQIDSKLFSPDNINKFFNKDQFNQELGRAEQPTIKPGIEELFENDSNQNNETSIDTNIDTEVRKILNTPIIIEQEATPTKDNVIDDLVEVKESEVKKKLQEILKILGITIERDADLPKDTLAKVDMLQKLISFSKGELTEDNFTEEVIHLIINIIEQKDPTLYDKMISEIWKFGIYKEVLDNYKDDPEYQTKEGKPDIAKLKKEAVVKLLVAKLVDNTNINDTKNIFGALWDKVSDFITNLFSKIPAYQRDLFEEFANDIVTKDNLINKEDVDKLGDGVFYSKKMSKANIFSSTMAKTKKAFGVASVEDYHLIIPSLKDSKEIFDLLKKINEETSLVVAREINPETSKEEEVTYYVTGTGMKKRVSTVLNEIKTNIGNYKTIDETEITAFIKEEKMKKGTEIHSTIEEIIGRHIDKETGFLKVTPEDRPQNIAIPEKYYNILEKHLKERLISYPKDTRFMVETKIVNEVYGYAGTIDFLAILPTGQVDILDWKSMDLSYNIGGKSMKREDVHALTKQVHRQQLALYKQALLSVGVKNFRQTRTIPIIVENTTKKINKSKSFEDPKNLVIRLTSLEIGNVDPNKEAKSYLLPISTSNEEVFDDITGKPISFLNTLIEKLEAYKAHSLEQRAQSTTLDRDRLLDQIQRTDKTIQELRSKKTTNLLITVFEDELFNINELSKKTFSFLKDNKNLSDLIPEQQQELRLYFDKMYENHNFLSSFLKVFPTLGELETIHKDMSPELVKSINSVKAKITISEEKLTVAVTKTMNQVGTILGIDDNVSDIDVKSSTMINSYSLYSRPELSLQMFTRLQKMINYLKEQEVQSFDSKMEKLMVGLQSWVKTNKTNLEGVYSKVYDKVNRRLIYKYKKEYFQTLFDKKEEAIKKHRDIIKGVSIQLSSKERITQISKEYRAYITPFIKENYDIKKYVQLYEEAYKAYKEVVDNYIFDADPFENADIQAKKLEEWEYRHNIFTNPKALQTSGFNKNELLFQTINEDKWISDEYRELLKPENKEVFDFYNQLQDILTDAKDSGMIESLNNLPEVKNDSFKMFTYLKAGLFKNYILSKFYAFYDRFLTDTYSSQNISDPFTNKDKKKIRSKYNNTFFLKRKPLESPEAYQERYNKEKVLYDMSLSKDLFYIFSVFGHHVIEYKILKEYESRFQLLSIVENNKTKEINTDNSKGNITLPLDDSGMPYYDDNKKLGITEGDKGTLRDLNRHIDYYLYNDKLAPKGALMNIVNWLYSLTTQVNLGFTYTAPLTNLVAGLTNSTLTNNTYYNSSDFQNSILPAIKDKNTAVNVKNFTKLNKMFNPFVEMSDQVYTTNKYKTTEKRYINVTKASLFLYSAGDHIIQSKIIASIYYGTTVDENNNIISVEDFINNKYPDRYNLPKEERIKLAKKIDKEIKEYKKTNSLYNLVSTNSLNLDAKNNILLTSIIEDTIAKTLGNYSEQDINTFMTKWWAKFVTQHKKWLGETIATRLEPFNVNKNTNLLEWGRMRLSLDLLFASYGKHIPFLVFHNMSSVLPEIVRKSVNKNNTITLEDIAKERYKVMQVEFFKKTSKNLKVTEAEFIRFYVRQYENSLKEAKSLLTLFLLAKFILPFIVGGDDDDNKEKDTYRTTLDIVIVVLTRSLREQSFVFNPEQLKIMLLQGPIPTIGTAWNLIDSYIYAPLKETYFTLTGDDEALKTNRVIDKQLNATPAKGINKIVKQISPSYRKLLDARRPKIQ